MFRSYIYYGTILGFIHSRIGTPIPKLASWRANTQVTEQITVPVVAVLLVLALYFMNMPGIRASGDIIEAFKAQDPDTMMIEFRRALSRGSFGDQEIREQMTRRIQEVTANQSVPAEKKAELSKEVEAELLKQIEEKPNDARAHVFIASFYRSEGTAESLDKAIVQLERARELSPRKQQIIFEQGLAHLQRQNYDRALEYFKEAYELDTTYTDARVFYAMSGIAAGRYNIIDEVIITDSHKDVFNTNDLVVQVAYNAKVYPLLKTIFEYRIAKTPADPQVRTNLAFILDESGDTAGAIEVIKKAIEDIPSFKEQGEQFMTQLAQKSLGAKQQ